MKDRYTIEYNKSQSEIIVDNSRFKALICGRRYGKSTIAEGIMKINASEGDKEILYIATTYGQAKKIMLNRLLNGIPKSWLKKRPLISQIMEFNFTNGSNIYLAGGKNYEVFRGMEFDLVVIDEVADQKPEMWFEVLRPALADRKGSAVFLGTPKGKNNWFYDLTLNKTIKTFHRTSIDGGRISEDEIELLKLELDERTYRQEILAEFIVFSGSVYYGFSDKVLCNYEFNPNLRTYVTFDFNVNPMTAVIVQEYETGKYVAVKEFYMNNSNTYEICEEIKKYLDYNLLNNSLTITGDNAGTYRSSNSPLSNYKIIDSILGRFKGYNKKLRRTDRIVNKTNTLNKALLDRKIMINKMQCPELVKELGFLEYDKTGKIDNRGGTVGHITDAFSYFGYNFIGLTSDKILKVA